LYYVNNFNQLFSLNKSHVTTIHGAWENLGEDQDNDEEAFTSYIS